MDKSKQCTETNQFESVESLTYHSKAQRHNSECRQRGALALKKRDATERKLDVEYEHVVAYEHVMYIYIYTQMHIQIIMFVFIV